MCAVRVQGISDLKYSPDSSILAAATFDQHIDLYATDAKHYIKIGRCSGHSSTVRGLDWSRDGSILQSACSAYETLYWNGRNGRQITRSQRDTAWATFTLALGFPVMGIWPDKADGTDINSLDRYAPSLARGKRSRRRSRPTPEAFAGTQAAATWPPRGTTAPSSCSTIRASSRTPRTAHILATPRTSRACASTTPVPGCAALAAATERCCSSGWRALRSRRPRPCRRRKCGSRFPAQVRAPLTRARTLTLPSNPPLQTIQASTSGGRTRTARLLRAGPTTRLRALAATQTPRPLAAGSCCLWACLSVSVRVS